MELARTDVVVVLVEVLVCPGWCAGGVLCCG